MVTEGHVHRITDDKPSRHVQLSLDPDLVSRFDALVSKNRSKRSWVVAHLMRYALGEATLDGLVRLGTGDEDDG